MSLILTFGASQFGITNVARRASALDHVVVHVAVHVSGARIHGTRILASIVDAGLVRWAIRVGPATKKNTGRSRVTSIARWTFTDGLVIDAMTLGAFSTGGQGWRAHWNAVVLYASVRSTAISIRATSGD